MVVVSGGGSLSTRTHSNQCSGRRRGGNLPTRTATHCAFITPKSSWNEKSFWPIKVVAEEKRSRKGRRQDRELEVLRQSAVGLFINAKVAGHVTAVKESSSPGQLKFELTRRAGWRFSAKQVRMCSSSSHRSLLERR